MKREIYEKLLEWKSRRDHKPLVLDGARQVGKTYILKEFGSKEYKNFSYVNLDKDAVANPSSSRTTTYRAFFALYPPIPA